MNAKQESTFKIIAIIAIISFIVFMGSLAYIALTSPKMTLDRNSWVCTKHQYNLVTKSTVCKQYTAK